MISAPSRRLTAVALLLILPALGSAQQAQQQGGAPALDFSGVLFGSYSYRTDSAASAAFGGAHPNQFSVDRAYLTFRMPAGQNGQIRITTDFFQNTNNQANAFYQGWAIRLKYAYAQYTGLHNVFGAESSLTGRVGILHTVITDYEEGFWPRYLSQVGPDRDGFFPSADAGLAGLLTLGNHWGEVYGTVTAGPGYTSYEKDRFKDFALRLSLTPFANRDALNPILRSFSITPWFYKGLVGSAFQAGGTGQVGPGENGAVTDGLTRNRWGVFTGVKDRRVTAGIELAQRVDESETGSNTIDSPRVVRDSTGRLIDGFVIVRPFEWFHTTAPSGFSLIGRYDHFTPNTDTDAIAYARTTPSYDYWVLGAAYDLTPRLTFALDWQVQNPVDFPAQIRGNVVATPRQSTLFAHWQAAF